MEGGRKALATDALWALAAMGLSALACLYLYGSLEQVYAARTGLYDARYYDLLGRALWQGHGIPADRLALRGYLYPMFATGLAMLSPLLFLAAQTALVGIGVFSLCRAERAMTGRLRLAPLSLLSLTLLLSPSLMMTESVAFGLASLVLWLLVRRPFTPWGVAVLVAGALVKPALVPVAALALILGLRPLRRALPALAVIVALLAPQLVATTIINGRPVISSAGALNFRQRFYPAVLGMGELGRFIRGRSDEAVAARRARPALSDQIAYVLARPVTALRTWAYILWTQHLTADTGFSRRDNTGARPGPQATLSRLSLRLNTVFLLLLPPGLAGAGLWLARSPARRWPAALLPLSIFASAPLVYFQGDRIVFIGFLTLLPFAALAMGRLFGGGISASGPPDGRGDSLGH